MMTRKPKFVISLIVGLCIIGIPIFFIWREPFVNIIDAPTTPELIYFSAQVVGAIFTVLAVLVALFGKEIRAFYFAEHLKIQWLNEGFYENKGNSFNEPNPVVHSYDATLSITNDGAKEISDLQILIKEVYYKDVNSKGFKRIAIYDYKPLYWSIPEIVKTDLLVGDSLKMPLIKIYPEDSCQTPDRSSYSLLRIKIIGCWLDEKYSKKGSWKVVYQIKSKEKILIDFECEAYWNGNWCNRLTEMTDCVSVDLKIK